MKCNKKEKALKRLADGGYSSADQNKFDLERARNLAKGSLDKDVLKVKGTEGVEDYTEPKTVVGKTEHIDNRNLKPIKTGAEFELHNNLRVTMKDAIKRGDTDMMKKLHTIAKKVGRGAKAVPVIGALAGLIGAEDASAALPILDSADSAGMSSQDENVMLGEIQARKDYDNSQAKKDRLLALAKLAKLREEQ